MSISPLRDTNAPLKLKMKPENHPEMKSVKLILKTKHLHDSGVAVC